MENQQVVNINDATNAELLQQPDERAQKLCTDARGFGHTEAHGGPLQALPPNGVPEAAVLPLGWVKTHREITIGQVP